MVKMKKGIRQGDPISSFICTIVSETLTYVILKTNEQKLIDGVAIGKNKIELTHYV